MQINWPPEHSEALRECLAKGMSFAESADAINAKFDTAYSRNAALSRAKRIGLASFYKPLALPRSPQQLDAPRLHTIHTIHTIRGCAAESKPLTPNPERPDRVQLRCIQITPRHLPLIDLEVGDCRYPYGGDAEGEAITFCGHPQREDSSYCIGHFHLTRGPGTASERAAVQVALRLVEAA